MKKLRAEMKACSDRDLLDEYLDRFRKRCKELQKDLREDVPHKVLYSSRGTRYYWLQENVLSFLRNRINVKSIDK